MTELSDREYKRLFKASPGKVLVLRPNTFEIVAATDAYLQATMTQESHIVGKTLFEVFPNNPDDPLSAGVQNLSASLMRVQALKAADIVGILRYPVRRPDGSFEERFWSPVNSPVLNDVGDIEFIMHRVEDVTTIVQEGDELSAPVAGSGDRLAADDIILRSQELRQALSRLQEYQARMRTAERLLQLGAWEYNLQTHELNWSKQVYEIYDVASETALDLDSYFSLVHPADRDSSRATYEAFSRQHQRQIEFEHRVITRDGGARHIKGVGERHASPDGEIVVGYVQDITSLKSTRDRLSQAEQLLQLAGDKAQLGGWHVHLDTETIVWTPGTAAIHGAAPGYSPENVSAAIQFYLPEFRGTLQEAFEKCARLGEEFDVICQIEALDGRRPWVRSIGIPERDQQGRIRAVQGAFQDISKLRAAQETAKQADRQRLDVLESIGDAFYALDDAWNFTYVNRKGSALLERARDELLGRNIWSEFPEAVNSEIGRQYRWVLENQTMARFREFYAPLGKWFEISAYPIPDGLAVYFQDISVEQERQEQLRLVDAALSRQNDAVIITEADSLDGPDGPRIVYVNDAFEQLTGFAKREVIGHTPRMLQGPDTERTQLDRIRNALRNQEPVRCEIMNYKKSREPYWVEIDITPLFDDQGGCTHYVAVQRNIVQRKQQEAGLRQAQERFELISRATNDVIWDWNLTTNKVWWSDAMADVFGYALADLEPGPESSTRRIHPDDRERVKASVREIIDGKDESWFGEYRFCKSNGQFAHVIDRGFVMRDETGTAIRMVGSMLDITERMDMEQRLRESQKLEAVGHLTGGVAHDFNNLLTVIMGSAETLAELMTDPELQPMAEMALSAAQRGAELTSRLLAFARRQPLNPKLTDLNRQMEAMRGLFRRTLPENIELELVPEANLWTTEVDASELDTALLNLVVNARDAMRDGGKLTIETVNAVLDSDYAARHSEVTPGDYVMICVSDTGFGMDPDTVSRAFEPFFTTKEVGKGSGLGLSMVFGFTKQSGGHFKIYSELNEGTSVKLYFPRARGAQQPSDRPAPEGPPQGGSEHILIAEDDDLVLQHLRDQLRSLGYRVTQARSGPEALNVLSMHSDIDLLLTDIIMPGGMNGRELAEQSQAVDPLLKVLFTSGYTDNAIIHHGRLDPGLDLLSKPYTRQDLATKVRLALDRQVTS